MDSIKDNAYYADKIREDLEFIAGNMNGVSIRELEENQVLQDSMMFRLIKISENVKKLSEEFKEEHSDIPWTAIYGLRNRIVHDYGSVDLEIVFYTLTTDVSDLLEVLKSI